ncbi:MAG: TlpA disulfide reductase family protein [Candidatus Krumholzibacteria bacterium]|nr:TlpA disulfide reductase family protein [Candidatus Krumholzibacteria bacterium]
MSKHKMKIAAVVFILLAFWIPPAASAQSLDTDSLLPRFQPTSKSIVPDSLFLKAQRYIASRRAKFIGKPAPIVVTTTIAGDPWRLTDQKGKIVVVDFWATWCIGCRPTTEAIEQLREKYKDYKDVLFVGVALDEKAEPVINFCRTNNMAWIQLFEPGKMTRNGFAKAFDVWTIPEVCIIDKNGIVASVFGMSKEEIDRTIIELLGR